MLTVLQDTARQMKKDEAKALIEKIPTEKDELFAYVIDWAVIDEVRCYWS